MSLRPRRLGLVATVGALAAAAVDICGHLRTSAGSRQPTQPRFAPTQAAEGLQPQGAALDGLVVCGLIISELWRDAKSR